MVNVKQISNGEGWVGEINGKKVAIYNDNGQLTVLENVCTHRRCKTDWNSEEKTWDCPCHGSRFNADGSVLKGPAKEPLVKLHHTLEGETINVAE